MKTQAYKFFIITVITAALVVTSCVKDLDTIPLDKDVVTSATVYDNPASYRQVLAKLYAGLAVTGQIGPHGDNDLSGLDEGFGQYVRAYWYAQELPTDEAVIAWNDGNLRDYQEVDWSSSNEFIRNMYYRIFYQISLCNEFIRESADSKLDERGIGGADKTDIQLYRAEARFLRALSYWHALDMFGGNVPFVTEDDKVGSFFPEQTNATDLFAYVESELLDILDDLKAPMQNEYARVDQAAAWMLLAKLYLNAEVYINTAKYTECLTYINQVIAAGYTLDPDYAHLFMADNHTSSEIIFPVAYDGIHTKTWGGTTFIVHAAVGGSMNPTDFGIDSPWGGTRVTKAFVSKFMDISVLKSGKFSLKSAMAYPVIYVPGGHNSWDPADTTSVLASVLSDNNYEGYLWFGSAGNEFKFTEGPNWDVNYGDDGADGTLDAGGANIVSGDAGYYKLNVDLTAKTYTMLKTDWGIIGSATADGWDADQNMTYDETEEIWSVILELNAGEIKFRANDGWDLNYGDDGANGILEQGGANIAIAEMGKYQIRLKLGAPDYTYTVEKYSSDTRGMFYTDGQSLEINDMFEFTEGWAITKWTNVTSAGVGGSDLTHCDTDFPVFRLGDAYLMYAEAVLRGGTGGNAGTALQYVNDLRERSYGDDGGNITGTDLTLDFILDERARELYWEAQRRTDLVRFGKFSGGDYLWPWKGGVKDGISVDSKYDIFPIPASDVGANPNLVQNTGY
jgi:hypothetical protein